MPLDFSGVDAELDALGSAPEHAVALARTLAGIDVARDQLPAIDRELGLLETGIAALPPAPAGGFRAPELPPVPSRISERVPAPPVFDARAARDSEAPELSATRESGPAPAGQSLRAPPLGSDSDGLESWPPLAHSEPPEAAGADTPASAVHSVPPPPALTQSQEIVLPDPIPREELSSESGELRLDDDKPSSGSFSLDEEPQESPFDEPRTAASEPPPPPPRRPRLSQLVHDDVGEALEGSQPISIGNSKRGPSKAPPFSFDRDPDAEFDALLSEATDPNGIPTGETDAEVDDLLQGLREDDSEELHRDLPTTDFNPDSSAETEVHDATEELAALMLEEQDDETDVLDRATLGVIEAEAAAARARASAAPHTAAEAAIEGAMPAQEDTLTEEFDSSELEMGELEIVMDEAPTKAPPPPPPPSSAPEKRPSGFLGRFFGRNERE